MSRTGSPLSRRRRASCCWCEVSFGLRPSFTPRALLAAFGWIVASRGVYAANNSRSQRGLLFLGLFSAECLTRHRARLGPINAKTDVSSDSCSHEREASGKGDYG